MRNVAACAVRQRETDMMVWFCLIRRNSSPPGAVQVSFFLDFEWTDFFEVCRYIYIAFLPTSFISGRPSSVRRHGETSFIREKWRNNHLAEGFVN